MQMLVLYAENERNTYVRDAGFGNKKRPDPLQLSRARRTL